MKKFKIYRRLDGIIVKETYTFVGAKFWKNHHSMKSLLTIGRKV